MALTEPRIAIPLRTRAEREKRTAERFDVCMPVRVEGVEGTTRDLSANGLAFDSDRAYTPGERVDLTIDYLLDGHNYPLKCQVEVVRSEPAAGRFRIGARLLAPLTDEPLQQE